MMNLFVQPIFIVSQYEVAGKDVRKSWQDDLGVGSMDTKLAICAIEIFDHVRMAVSFAIAVDPCSLFPRIDALPLARL
jgi:hypothetical protein